MAAPFTQAYIQTQIDYYAEQMKIATASQEYEHDQGPVGQFKLRKGRLESIQEALDYWLGLMEKYYPDAFEVQPKIEFNEVAYLNG